MAGVLNVNPDVTDQFYRYKMPRLIAKVEGKGNGIKTVIPNMVEVAKSLDRPATYPTKYFGCELGAQTQFDYKNERYIVNGSHDSAKLQDLLGNFIRKFVLCPECDNPETHLAVQQKKGMILQRCIACGHQGNIDMRHKLTTFILKNPPDQDPSAASATPAKKDKKAKGKRGSGKKDGMNGDTSPNQANQKGPNVPPAVGGNDEDDVDWGEDVSDAAVQQRMEELSDAAQKLTVAEDIEKTQQERIDLFYQFVKGRKETYQITGVEKEKEVVTKAETLEVKEKAPLILVELLYDESILPAIKQYRNLFLRFNHGNPKAQKYMLGGLEQLIGTVHKDSLLPKAAGIFKVLYECDILDEEVILDWAKKGPSKKYVSKEVSKEIHTKVAPFITWLEEAEEESEDDDDEDDVEVVYSHTEKVGTQTIPAADQPKKKEEEEDDFDIDAI